MNDVKLFSFSWYVHIFVKANAKNEFSWKDSLFLTWTYMYVYSFVDDNGSENVNCMMTLDVHIELMLILKR